MSFDVAEKQLGFVPRLLAAERRDFVEESRRALAGLSLSALFGVVIGARYGVASMAVHGVGVPLGFVVGAGLALPALCIFVAHFDLPVDTRAVVHAVARGIAVTGLVLAGLAPGALLLTLSAETSLGASCFGALGLMLASLIGVGEVVKSLQSFVQAEYWSLKALLLLFVIMAGLLAARTWWFVLPMLGRAAVGS